jgi:hypothetical protein
VAQLPLDVCHLTSSNVTSSSLPSSSPFDKVIELPPVVPLPVPTVSWF